eukprot:1374417-Rhodomonas_salina.1
MLIPLADTMCPRNSTWGAKNSHLASLAVKEFSTLSVRSATQVGGLEHGWSILLATPPGRLAH